MNGTPSNRFVTFTFDDGLIRGCRRAATLMEERGLRGTFFVVTGWVRPNRARIRDPWNRGRDHGDWSEWMEIAARGHEVGSHTVSQINATGMRARFLPGLLKHELKGSHHELASRLRRSPVSIGMPWNAATPTSDRLTRRWYEAARLGQDSVCYNDTENVHWYALRSWAPSSDTSLDRFREALRAIPPGHWLILQFHSLDDEGYMPLAAEKLEGLLELIAADDGIETVTIRDMVERLKRGAPISAVP